MPLFRMARKIYMNAFMEFVLVLLSTGLVMEVVEFARQLGLSSV